MNSKSKTKVLLFVFLLISIITSVSVTGCSRPEVKSAKMHWGVVNSSVTQIISNIYVSDPFPLPIPLSGVNVKLYMNGIEMGTGHSIGKTSISPPGGNITLEINLINKRLVDWWVTHIRNNEKTTVKVVSNLEFNLLGLRFGVPVTRTSTFKTSILSFNQSKTVYITSEGITLGEISNVKLRWGDVTPNSTQVILEANVKNLVDYPIKVKYLKYEIYMNDIKMGSGNISKNIIINPKSQDIVEFIMYINNSKIPKWWVSHIKNNETTNVKVKMSLGLEVNGRSMVLPLKGYSYTFKTNILHGMS